ncbi:MAG: response regulator [Bdellovibrionales bacterium]|nr:response regulator [Bdellovibrionales bacterium]
MMAAQKFDLVFCDFHLGDMKGVEVLRNFRQKHGPTKPFIMITSDVTKEELNEALNAGVSSYLLKPFTIEQVEGNIQLALERL